MTEKSLKDEIAKVFDKQIQLHDFSCPDTETNQWNELFRSELESMKKQVLALLESKLEQVQKCTVHAHSDYFNAYVLRSDVISLIGAPDEGENKE